MHFGKWIFASSILGFIVANSDRLLLGAMVDATTFGVCVIAFLMVGAVEQVVGRLTGGVTLSALSEVARKGGDLRAAYYRLHAVIAAVAYFSAGFLMIAGQALVAVLYDHRYADAGWMLQICAALLTAPFQTRCKPTWRSAGRSCISRILAVRLAALFAAYVRRVSLFFGLPGALGGVVIGSFVKLHQCSFFTMSEMGSFDLCQGGFASFRSSCWERDGREIHCSGFQVR